MRTDSGPSILWPLLLAVAGVAALSTAIILVPSMARRLADARGAGAFPCPETGAPAAPRAVDPIPPQVVAPVAPAPAAPAAGVSSPPPSDAQPAAAPAALPGGPWTIALDPGDYALLGDGQAAIDAIVGILARDAKVKVALTGVNNPNKSSKRAKRAAESVKERIVADVGVDARQVDVAGAQDPAVDGLVVRAEIAGGGR